MDALETKKAQLAAQVAAITQELTLNSEDIRRYRAEQMMVLTESQTWSETLQDCQQGPPLQQVNRDGGAFLSLTDIANLI